MKKTTNSAKCQYTGAAKQSKNGIVPYEDDEQLKEKFGIIDKLAAMLRGKEVPEKHRYGWLKFWLMVVLLVLVGGGFYYLGNRNQQPAAAIDLAQVDKLVEERIAAEQAKAEEARRAAEQRAARQADAEAARQDLADDIIFDLDRSKEMMLPDACFKQYKLARARKTLEKAKAAGTDSQLYQAAEQELKRLLNENPEYWEGKGCWVGFLILAAIFFLFKLVRCVCTDPRRKGKYYEDELDALCHVLSPYFWIFLFVTAVIGLVRCPW